MESRMNSILNKSIVLVLNRNWQAINVRTPQDAFCQMAANVVTALEIAAENHIRPVSWDESCAEGTTGDGTDSQCPRHRRLEALYKGMRR
jgi:hypothetical protein